MTIPDNVTSIGNYAFYICDSLTSVTIGNSVESIGNYAFYICGSLTSVEIPDSVTSIGRSAFSYCGSLTHIDVDSDNSSYKSIDGVLFTKDGKSLIQYPIGRTATTYTIPDSVTSIGYSAFHWCDSLTSVEISDSVTSIETYAFSSCYSLTIIEIPASVEGIGFLAFSHCDSLTRAYFKGNTPKSFGPEVFYDCAEGFTIYYTKVHESAWAPNGETTWKGYPIALYDPISEGTIPVEDNEYDYISVLRANDKTPIKGVSIVAKCGQTTYNNLQTDSNGLARLDLSVAVNNVENNLKVEASHSGYNSSVEMFKTEKGKRKIYTVLLIPIGDEKITAVTCNNENILTGKKSVSLSETTKLAINVKTTYGTGRIDQYQLIQDGSVIATSTTPSFTPFLISLLKADIPIWIRLKLVNPLEPNKFTYSKPIKLGLTAYYHQQELPSSGTSVQLMDKLTFTVPSDIPLIGNKKMSIDLGNIPLVVGYEDDTIRLGYGFTDDFDTSNDDLWHNLKKSTIDKKIDKGIKQYRASVFGAASTGWSNTVKFDVYGYAEGKLNSDPNVSGIFKSLSGNVCIEMSVKFKKDWQTVVWVIPVVIKLSVNVGINNTFSIGYDFEEKQMFIKDQFEVIFPGIELSAGIGLAKIADISVYGSVENKIGFNTETRYKYAQLDGEAGVSVFALFWSKKYPIVSGTWKYYESFKGYNSYEGKSFEPYNADAYSIESRDYLKTQSEWLGSIPLRDTLSSRVETLLQSGVYGATEPQMISAGDTTCLVYLADNGTRATGNHTELVYSFYNESNNTWSDPVAVWDDGTADFYPKLATDGTDIYVTWVDAKTAFDESVTIEQMAPACEISIAKLTESGAVDQRRVTNNSSLDFMPSIVFDNDEPVVIWSRNSNGDILNQTGANTILYAKPGSSETIAQTVTTPINALDAGILNGQAHVAFSTDADGDINTTNDTEVYVGGVGGSFTALTENQTYDLDAVFAKIGTKNCLAWLSEEGLKVYDGTSTKTYEVTVGSEFRIVSNGSGITYLVYSKSEGDGGSLYISQYDAENDHWMEAITLSDTQGYAEHPTAVVNKQEGLLAVYTRTDATITETEIQTSSDLYAIRMFPSYNLTLKDVDFDESEVALGGELPVILSVTNSGEKEVLSSTVTVSNNGAAPQTFIIDTPILSGETTEVEIQYVLPDTATTNEFVFSIVPSMDEGDNEFNTQDNAISKSLFNADLSVTSTKLFSDTNNAVQIVIQNKGFVSTNATLSILRDTIDGENLGMSDLGSIEAGSMKIVTLSGDYLDELMDGSECLFFDVKSSTHDMNLGNNDSFVTVTELETAEWVAPVEVLLGDANRSGSVDSADASQILRWVVKLIKNDAIDLTAANVTGGSTVSSADASKILRWIVKLIPTLDPN